MFCSSCGQKLPEGAKFCFNCGAQAGVFDFAQSSDSVPKTKIVPAKCTSCGASLNVDPNQESAICPYCRSAYIVEKAINEYNVTVKGNFSVNGATININGKNLTNLIERANQCARSGDFPKALDYFNEVLDSDANSIEATEGIQKIQSILNDYVYFREETPKGILELKKGRLILTNDVGPTLYELSRIFELSIVPKGIFSSGKIIQFTYDGIPRRKISLDTAEANKWFVVIEDAKMGKYPKMVDLGKLYV